MTVNLSLLAGAGAQFFDNNGVALAGGLVYTYAAGTTTPQAAYTTSAGSIAHANPIVLDSAGRVPSGGEIWLTQGQTYKFVLKTSASITVGTYDNIVGASDPANIYATFAASSGSSLVGYTQGGTGAVATTVQTKLRQLVTPEDFGAVGDGVTDDGPAMQLACNYCCLTGATLWMSPKDYYKARIEVHGTYCVQGNGATVMFLGCGQTMIYGTGSSTAAIPTSWPLDPGYQPYYAGTTIYALASAVTIGNKTVTLTSATGITAGMYLFLFGKPSDRSSTSNFIPYDFEWIRVKSIVGNVITLSEPAKSNYALSNQSGLSYGPGIDINCEVNNLKINTSVDAYQYVVRGGVNLTLRNITLIGQSGCGANTFCKNLLIEHFTATSTDSGPDHGRGCESVTWNTASVSVSQGGGSVFIGSYIEESFYNITFIDYKIYGGYFSSGNIYNSPSQRPRKVSYINCFADTTVFGATQSPFTLSGMPSIEVNCVGCTFKGYVVTPYAPFYPSITGDALVWVSSNNSTDVVNFSNCRFISNNVGPTWPVAIGGFNGTVKFDDLCSYINAVIPYKQSSNTSGTWTPTVTGLTTAGVATYTSQAANYTLSGNLVTIQFSVAWSAHTGTGNIVLAGMPYTSNASTAGAFAVFNSSVVPLAVGGIVIAGTPRILISVSVSGAGSINAVTSYYI